MNPLSKQNDMRKLLQNGNLSALAKVELFAKAICCNEVELMNCLLSERDIDINRTLENGDSILIVAIKNNPNFVKDILSHRNIIVNAHNAENKTALNYAVQNFALSSTKLLIRRGAICCSYQTYTVSPLVDFLDLDHRSAEICECLLSNNATIMHRKDGRSCLAAFLLAQDQALTDLCIKHNPPEKMRRLGRAYRALERLEPNRENRDLAIERMSTFNPLFTKEFFGKNYSFIHSELKKLAAFVLSETKMVTAEELYCALPLQSEKVARYLLDCGIDCNERFDAGAEGQTLILNCVAKRLTTTAESGGESEAFLVGLAEKLLVKGADPFLKDSADQSAFEIIENSDYGQKATILEKFRRKQKAQKDQKENASPKKKDRSPKDKTDAKAVQPVKCELIIDETAPPAENLRLRPTPPNPAEPGRRQSDPAERTFVKVRLNKTGGEPKKPANRNHGASDQSAKPFRKAHRNQKSAFSRGNDAENAPKTQKTPVPAAAAAQRPSAADKASAADKKGALPPVRPSVHSKDRAAEKKQIPPAVAPQKKAVFVKPAENDAERVIAEAAAAETNKTAPFPQRHSPPATEWPPLGFSEQRHAPDQRPRNTAGAEPWLSTVDASTGLLKQLRRGASARRKKLVFFNLQNECYKVSIPQVQLGEDHEPRVQYKDYYFVKKCVVYE